MKRLPYDDMDLDSWIRVTEEQKFLPESEFKNLCDYVCELLLEESTVHQVSSPVFICGDVHGKFDVLEEEFCVDQVPKQSYILMGDFVNQDYFSLESFIRLLALKAKWPSKITVLRGNHSKNEMIHLNKLYAECYRKYGNANVRTYCSKVLNLLTVAALIDNEVLCVDGRLSLEIKALNKTCTVVNSMEISHRGAFCNLAWSDPLATETWSTNPRGRATLARSHGTHELANNEEVRAYDGLTLNIRNLDLERSVQRQVERNHKGTFCDLVWSDPENLQSWAISQQGTGWLLGSRMIPVTRDVESQQQTIGKRKLYFYSLINQLLIFFIIGPSALMVWRGEWKTFDAWLLPGRPCTSGWVSSSIGLVFAILMIILVQWKNKEWKLSEKTAAWKLVMYPMCVATIHAWRGFWMLFDYYVPTSLAYLLSCHLGSLVILTVTKTMSNTSFAPSSYTRDSSTTPFQINTALRTFKTNVSPFYKLFDCGFSVSVVTLCTVLFWWSTWSSMNFYLYPSRPMLSNLLSFVAGWVGIISCKLLDKCSKFIATKTSMRAMFLIQAVCSYVQGVSTVGWWRGAWRLTDVYAFPDYPVTFAGVSHVCGMIVLYITKSAINVTGCPCQTSSDTVDTPSVSQKTVGAGVSHPYSNGDHENESKRTGETEMKQLAVVSSTSDLQTSTLIMERK